MAIKGKCAVSTLSKDKFDERIEEIKILQRLLPEPDLGATASNRNLENAIHRASLVMLCSHVQGYLEDLVEEFLGNLKANRVISCNIPPELKVALCKRDLLGLNNDDRNILMERLPEFIRRYEILWCSTREVGPESFPEIIGKDWQIGNPWPKTVEAHLKKIGIKTFWCDANRILNGDLLSLVDKRNLIAHGHFEATATSDDIKRYIESMIELVGLVDNSIEDHLREIIKNR
jgi:hypothetical protein